jgi:hypothetical protein
MIRDEIARVRRAALKLGSGAGVSLRFNDELNARAIRDAIAYRTSAPLWLRNKWAAAASALALVGAAQEYADTHRFVEHAREKLSAATAILEGAVACAS